MALYSLTHTKTHTLTRCENTNKHAGLNTDTLTSVMEYILQRPNLITHANINTHNPTHSIWYGIQSYMFHSSCDEVGETLESSNMDMNTHTQTHMHTFLYSRKHTVNAGTRS